MKTSSCRKKCNISYSKCFTQFQTYKNHYKIMNIFQRSDATNLEKLANPVANFE